MKIFGDDGFRDIYGEGLLSKKFLKIFFLSFRYYLELNHKPFLLVGYDNRVSNKDIIKLIRECFKGYKIKIFKNPITTPKFSFYLKSQKFLHFGIMITASHFSHEYNGFKFFKNGKKMQKNEEKKIIDILKNKITKKKINIKNDVEIFDNSSYEDYINLYFKNLIIRYPVLFDFCNGPLSFFYKKIKILNAVDIINKQKNGKLINFNVGSNHLRRNIEKIKFIKNYKFIFAFDGDCDRVSIYFNKYGIIESEKISLFLSYYLKKKYKLLNAKIISTEICNPWLNDELNKINFNLINTKVGDRNVINRIKREKALFGFETSGHYSLFNDTMDGLLTSLIFIEAYNDMPNIFLKILNKRIKYNLSIYNLGRKISKIKMYLRDFNQKNKLILRKSIWTNDHKLYIFSKSNFFYDKKLKNFLDKNFTKIH